MVWWQYSRFYSLWLRLTRRQWLNRILCRNMGDIFPSLAWYPLWRLPYFLPLSKRRDYAMFLRNLQRRLNFCCYKCFNRWRWYYHDIRFDSSWNLLCSLLFHRTFRHNHNTRILSDCRNWLMRAGRPLCFRDRCMWRWLFVWWCEEMRWFLVWRYSKILRLPSQ
jgi:hypothetical protein